MMEAILVASFRTEAEKEGGEQPTRPGGLTIFDANFMKFG